MTKGNEPAFPVTKELEHDARTGAPVRCEIAYGLTTRDYFAAKALQGICAHPDTWGQNINGIATHAYLMADAMIRARDEVK